MLTWWGDIGSNARTNDSSVIGDVVGFSMIPGSDKVYNSKKGAGKITIMKLQTMLILAGVFM